MKPDAKSTDANIAYCMAMTPSEQLLPVLQRYGFETPRKTGGLMAFWVNTALENILNFLVRQK